MGLLDSLIGSVMNSAMGGGGQQQGGGVLGGLLNSLGNQGNQAASGGARAGMGDIGGGALLAMAMSVVQSQGGIGGLLAKFKQSGLGQHADSWVGTGPNMPVTGDQVHQVLGADAMNAIAAKMGVPAAQAGSTMAQILPELVNHLTPGGQVPTDHQSIIEDGLKMLQGMTRT